eukprot:TRINITY_DN6075_c0_g1_i2.p1 TRINITY_DN6075_c0_g1~~TRINITY_DN6075_c0_g1_i2.p1  ORF type:complete len:1800 (+),score=161.76 TRINITY_DN6075_c0_g1_i2:120-5519(+)
MLHSTILCTRAMWPVLLAALFLLASLSGAQPITCSDGTQSKPCCSDGSSAAAGAGCPDGQRPTDTCGTCGTSSGGTPSPPPPSGGTSAAVSCTQYPNANGFGVTQACGSTAIFDGPTFAEPPLAESSGGSLAVTLEVTPGTVDAGLYSFQSRNFKYNGVTAPVGPTLKFKPGDTVSITLVNSLSAQGNDNTKAHNTLRLPNTTNVHTHGLHVDPAVDNVYVSVEPGSRHTYTYTIPANHMPGIHWYHSHQHGASALHLMGGLVGALYCMDSSSSQVPADLKSMQSYIMVITHIAICSCNPTTDPFRIVSYQELSTKMGDTLPLNFQASVANGDYGGGSVLLVNGQLQPKLSLTVGQWTIFELVNAVGDSYIELEIRTAVNGGSTACSMTLLAIDGVYLHASRSITEFMFPPAGRASIAVMCATAGTFYLQSYPQARAADLEALVGQNLVTLEAVGNGPAATGPSWTKGSVDRAWYLQDLTNARVEGEWQIGVEQSAIDQPAGAHLGVGTDCTIPCGGRADCEAIGYSDPEQYGSCPHVAFEGYAQGSHYSHVGKLCSVEDLVIWGRGRTPHPIHVHVNHFQVVSSADGRYTRYWGQIGDFRDTVPAFVGATRVRYALADFGGVIINHCHFLFHEDQGMMSRIWVGDGANFCVASGKYPSFTYCDSNVPADGWSQTPASISRTCTAAEVQTMGLTAPSPSLTPPAPTPAPVPSPTPASLTPAPVPSPESTSASPTPPPAPSLVSGPRVGESCVAGMCGEGAWCLDVNNMCYGIGTGCNWGKCGGGASCNSADGLCWETCYHTASTCADSIPRKNTYSCDYSSHGGRPSCGVTNSLCAGRGENYPCQSQAVPAPTPAAIPTAVSGPRVGESCVTGMCGEGAWCLDVNNMCYGIGTSCNWGKCGGGGWCNSADNLCWETCYHTASACADSIPRKNTYSCDYSSHGGRPSCGVTNSLCTGRGENYPCPSQAAPAPPPPTPVPTGASGPMVGESCISGMCGEGAWCLDVNNMCYAIGTGCNWGKCGGGGWCNNADGVCYETCYNTATACADSIPRKNKYSCDYSNYGGRPSCGVTNSLCSGRGENYPCPSQAAPTPSSTAVPLPAPAQVQTCQGPCTCNDGSQSLPCCSDGSTASAGGNCPDGQPPTDTCGTCSISSGATPSPPPQTSGSVVSERCNWGECGTGAWCNHAEDTCRAVGDACISGMCGAGAWCLQVNSRCYALGSGCNWGACGGGAWCNSGDGKCYETCYNTATACADSIPRKNTYTCDYSNHGGRPICGVTNSLCAGRGENYPCPPASAEITGDVHFTSQTTGGRRKLSDISSAAVQKAIAAGLGVNFNSTVSDVDASASTSTLVASVSIQVAQDMEAKTLNTLQDAMLSDFANHFEDSLVGANEISGLSSVWFVPNSTSLPFACEFALDCDECLKGLICAWVPDESRCATNGGLAGTAKQGVGIRQCPAPTTTPSAQPSRKNKGSLRNGRNLTGDEISYLSDRMSLSMPTGCMAKISSIAPKEYTRGEYLVLEDITISGDKDVTASECEAVLQRQLANTSVVSSLHQNAMFEKGGNLVVMTDGPGATKITLPDNFEEVSLFVQPGFMPVAAERCYSGAMVLSEVLSPFDTGGAPSAPQFECQSRQNCTAFIHHWPNHTLLLWSGKPDLTEATGLAVVKHPLCMVKVQVFCGNDCPPALLENKVPCRCPEGFWPIPRCEDGSVADAGADCADGKPPKDRCSDGSVCDLQTFNQTTMISEVTTTSRAADVSATSTTLSEARTTQKEESVSDDSNHMSQACVLLLLLAAMPKPELC